MSKLIDLIHEQYAANCLFRETYEDKDRLYNQRVWNVLYSSLMMGEFYGNPLENGTMEYIVFMDHYDLLKVSKKYIEEQFAECGLNVIFIDRADKESVGFKIILTERS